MYKDIITNLKIPGFYCLLNSKKEILYNYVLESIINILNPHKKFKLEIETIVTDQEQGLVNAVEVNFQMPTVYPAFFIINKIYYVQ